jgi:acyl-CoA reductase-like NAD-dependent aldehyde dehydrogenase
MLETTVSSVLSPVTASAIATSPGDGGASGGTPSSVAAGGDVVDTAVQALLGSRTRWAATGPGQRADLLDWCRERFFAVAPAVVEIGLAQKSLPPTAPEAGEEWAFVLGVLKILRAYATALREVERHGRPRVPGPWSVRADGRVTVRVAPGDLAERLALLGGSGEVWLRPGIDVEEARARQGERWRTRSTTPRVLALLGAGNVPLLIPGDVLHALLLDGDVVVLKLNPVNEALAPLWRETFAPLVHAGGLQILTGDAAVGARLCTHPAVDAIHMTGSHHTYEAVVFGPGAVGAERKARGIVDNKRPVTAELGNITPVFVVPGPFSAAELRYHAVQLAAQHALNAAHNCLTPRLIVVARGWPLRAAFLDALRAAFAALPRRRAYYPGSAARHARVLAAHPDAEQRGAAPPLPTDDALPWTLIPGLSATAHDEPCFREESFCATLAEVVIDADDVCGFLAGAIAFANETAWGNLTATLLVHPAVQRDPDAARAVDDAVGALRYGAIGINTFGSFCYATPSLPWGAYPGNGAFDIQSGVGFVNNVLDLPSVEKAVLRAPFAVGRDPPLDLRRPSTAALLRAVAGLEYRVTAGTLVDLFRAARGH